MAAAAEVPAAEVPAVVLDNISKSFGSNTVLDGVSLTINRGSIAVMLKSIAGGQVTEIKARAIKRWGPLRAKMFDGKPYWTATVTYPTTSMFGTFDTEGMALIRGDRVVHWLYPGSGESIP